MGKANRPFVIRIKPGETKEDALERALAKPGATLTKRNLTRVLIREESK